MLQQTNRVVLAQGTNSHTAVTDNEQDVFLLDTLMLDKDTPLQGAFRIETQVPLNVVHEIPSRPHGGNEREPHGMITLKPGVYTTTIQVEFDPFDLSVISAVD